MKDKSKPTQPISKNRRKKQNHPCKYRERQTIPLKK